MLQLSTFDLVDETCSNIRVQNCCRCWSCKFSKQKYYTEWSVWCALTFLHFSWLSNPVFALLEDTSFCWDLLQSTVRAFLNFTRWPGFTERRTAINISCRSSSVKDWRNSRSS
jgi:hypothetical protein